MAPLYRLGCAVVTPVVAWWGRLDVSGLSVVPVSGPVVLVANHDSAWDPFVIGVAARHRQVRALAKSSLWRWRPMGWALDRMGQIPIDRGRADAAALSAGIACLREGGCVGVFAEGTVSRGRALRPLSGAGRLVLATPGTRLVGVSVTGAVEIVRFPRRPRIRVQFFDPDTGPSQPTESAIALTRRVMAQVRARAPYAVPGRRRKAAIFRQLAHDYNATHQPNRLPAPD